MGIAKDARTRIPIPAAWSCSANTRCSPKARAASLTKQLIVKYSLDASSEPPKFGIGLKEVWEIDPAKHQKAWSSIR